MRKLSILSYIFAGLMLSSCDGYLKEDPRDQLYPEDAYDTPQNVYPVSYTHLTLPTIA